MTDDTILCEDSGPIRRITLNRPQKLNAMNAELVEALIASLHAADADANVAVIVLAGAGRAFSAGADISRRDGDATPSPRDEQQGGQRTVRLYKALLGTNTPIIAEIHGYALGGGCNLAMCADMVVASQDAVFGYPELKVGLAATAVAPPLVHQIGRKAAFELLTLCENVSAKRALELGMINRVVARDALTETAMAIGTQLAGFDHDALWATKRTIRRAADLALPDALDMASDIGFGMKLFAHEGTD
jgi:enoyl-CoA hydratase